LPFALPPGPYSSVKPDLSYAALIGRAILASPHHKLRLKDIYDYISICFPFYKREGHSHGQKWMNAIRQNLTNTPQFYKEVHP
ncbi:winged helix DNA-binding domain-containing protein, partial [Schizopora paradoxa]